MNILLTCDPILPVPPAGYGGIERIVDSLVRCFQSGGHTVGLVAKTGSICRANANFYWPGEKVSKIADTARNAMALRAAVRDFQPDVVQSFSRLAYLLPLLRSPVPKVMSYQRHTGSRQISVAARLGGEGLRFTGCSEFICNQGRPWGGTWTAIHNFVELPKFAFSRAVPADAPLVFLSRIERIKGPDLAIAIARASGRRLILAGNYAERGAERAFWDKEIAPSVGRDGIEYIGEVDDTRKNTLLGNAAALVVPIQWEEPFGIVFAEALACGTPILSCRRGALPEIVEDGRTGFFVSGVADGREVVQRIGGLDRAACRRAAEARFSAEVCSGKYLELYAEMTRNR